MASIHHKGSEFIRPNYAPSALDLRSRKKEHRPFQPSTFGTPFWAPIVGTPAERRLAQMMGAKVHSTN